MLKTKSKTSFEMYVLITNKNAFYHQKVYHGEANFYVKNNKQKNNCDNQGMIRGIFNASVHVLVKTRKVGQSLHSYPCRLYISM